MTSEQIISLIQTHANNIDDLQKIAGAIDSMLEACAEIGREDEHEDGMTDVEADADALASAGWGTDEDYGGAEDSYLDTYWEDQHEIGMGGEF